MSMKLSYLRTHFTADDAYTIIRFLEQIQDSLWVSYGQEITEMLVDIDRADSEGAETEVDELHYEEPIPF